MSEDKDLWKHRRRMAYMSLGGIIGLVGAIVAGEIQAAAADLGKAVAYALAGIVMAYIGGAVVDDVKARLDSSTK